MRNVFDELMLGNGFLISIIHISQTAMAGRLNQKPAVIDKVLLYRQTVRIITAS
jgi:hypothetical protein